MHLAPRNEAAAPARLAIPRYFTETLAREGKTPYDAVEWADRTAEILNFKTGETVFRQEHCEFPAGYSQQAVNVIAQKYFYGDQSKPAERERSMRQLIGRVVNAITCAGRRHGYFRTEADAHAFHDELTFLGLNQYAAFNSPVWFNVGLAESYGIAGSGTNWVWDHALGKSFQIDTAYESPQASACFIQAVADTMDDIMRLATSEAMLFKSGSGTGTDLSTLRSSREKLSGGGKPSGPLSFMRVYDAIAGVVKSGGKTRRAAKMQTLNVRHPDILEFIECKSGEEKKAQSLIQAGYDPDYNGDAYSTVLYQNANLTVRATDGFLDLAVGGGTWTTTEVTTGQPSVAYPASELLDKIALGTWTCGDPGMHYADTIQRWHTCPNTAPINSSNPCSEYLFIDDSACNLSSLNLLKFRNADGGFDSQGFRAAVRIMIAAQDILVSYASYPTAKIAENSYKFRPLGLGYANLGAFMMAQGLPYDSDEARDWAGAITALMHGEALATSATLAQDLAPFEGFAANRDPMLKVVGMHFDAVNAGIAKGQAVRSDHAASVWANARDAMRRGLNHGGLYGYRNSQVTVLAPTGTIAFMMDCDTTGIEPETGLVKFKKLAGGGNLKIVNKTVTMALQTLGYGTVVDDVCNGDISRFDQIAGILNHIEQYDTIEPVAGMRSFEGYCLKPEHLPVFDCAFAPAQGEQKRSIAWQGHVKMMAAVQPFLSGAISKTVNMPEDSTPAQIRDAYLEGWRLGLKAMAIYRDGSKGSQPLTMSKDEPTASDQQAVLAALEKTLVDKELQIGELSTRLVALGAPARRRLPDTRTGTNHKFDIQGHKGYLNVGFYADGAPGELFITMAKEGSTVGGLMDTIGTLVSMGLQYGVPLQVFVDKFAHQRFEPSGFTKNPDIPIAKSIVDYVFRWLGNEFLPGYRAAHAPNREEPIEPTPATPPTGVAEAPAATVNVLHILEARSGLHGNGHSNGHSNGHGTNGSVRYGSSRESLAVAVRPATAHAPTCRCGALMVPNGRCFRCANCGDSNGSCE